MLEHHRLPGEYSNFIVRLRVRILALETSLVTGSVAALDGARVVKQVVLDPAWRTARSLAPGVQALLRDVGWRPRDVELVATTIGPGSFTGVRVALATAKALAYAWNVPVVGIDTLYAIAAQVAEDCALVTAVVDAQRKQLFVESFRRDGRELVSLGPPDIVADEAWLAELSSAAPGTCVTGPGLERVLERLPTTVLATDTALWTPLAATVGELAWRAYSAGRATTWQLLDPLYIRPSAAEEKRPEPRPTA